MKYVQSRPCVTNNNNRRKKKHTHTHTQSNGNGSSRTSVVYLCLSQLVFVLMNIIDRFKAIFGENACEWYVNRRKIAARKSYINKNEWKWMAMARRFAFFHLECVYTVRVIGLDYVRECMCVYVVFRYIQTKERHQRKYFYNFLWLILITCLTKW